MANHSPNAVKQTSDCGAIVYIEALEGLDV